MDITIAERFRPFVTAPGTPCMLPNSYLRAKIFPTFIEIADLSKAAAKVVAEIHLPLSGPIKDFTVMQDLEKQNLRVWGQSKEGFFRYRLIAVDSEQQFDLCPEKVPEDKPDLFHGIARVTDYKEKRTVLPIPRLSFGVTKKADWTLVNRRCELSEILPFWYRLGKSLPSIEEHRRGIAYFLNDIEKAIGEKDPLALATSFKNLYLAGMSGLLAPSLIDEAHQGFDISAVSPKSEDSSLILLTRGAAFIEKMLVSTEEQEVSILSCVPAEIHAGRFCGVFLEGIGDIDLEWSKKCIRRMIFHSHKDQTVTFHFSKGMKSFRLRSGGHCSAKENNRPLKFLEGVTYCFDRFES